MIEASAVLEGGRSCPQQAEEQGGKGDDGGPPALSRQMQAEGRDFGSEETERPLQRAELHWRGGETKRRASSWVEETVWGTGASRFCNKLFTHVHALRRWAPSLSDAPPGPSVSGSVPRHDEVLFQVK